MATSAFSSSSFAAALLVAVLALLYTSAAARPGVPFHPCNTLFVTYTISNTAAADNSIAATHRSYRFASIYRIITSFSSSSYPSAYAFDDRRPPLIRRAGVPRRDVAEAAALSFSSLQERAKDILVVFVGLLFGVCCGALTAATMYLIRSLFCNRYEACGSYGEEKDYADESPKKAGYIKISASESAPAKEGYEGN